MEGVAKGGVGGREVVVGLIGVGVDGRPVDIRLGGHFLPPPRPSINTDAVGRRGHVGYVGEGWEPDESLASLCPASIENRCRWVGLRVGGDGAGGGEGGSIHFSSKL
jgi:hypothetical protein